MEGLDRVRRGLRWMVEREGMVELELRDRQMTPLELIVIGLAEHALKLADARNGPCACGCGPSS